ncbi:gas vesicle protein GvpC [Limnospira platensis]|uniref:gas vesicle protein GvpC n=1 Tax=Limnospira platensis TaxID=118562 RepID=UPI0021A9B20B|nr:gas vesicle protein GvpC repeat-containing protein [Arthrospira platensis C1]
MALQDDWQQSHLERRQVLAESQKQIWATIGLWQRERYSQAITQKQDRQAFVSQLKQENQAFLADAHNNHRQQAEQLAEDLKEFVRSLQKETATFLEESAQSRAEKAEELAQELRDFGRNFEIRLLNGNSSGNNRTRKELPVAENSPSRYGNSSI